MLPLSLLLIPLDWNIDDEDDEVDEDEEKDDDDKDEEDAMLERTDDARGSCTEGFKRSGALDDACASIHSLYDVCDEKNVRTRCVWKVGEGQSQTPAMSMGTRKKTPMERYHPRPTRRGW